MRSTSTAVRPLLQGRAFWNVALPRFPLALASKDRFRAAGQTTPIGIAIADADGAIVQANRHLLQWTGCSPDELIAQPLEMLFPKGMRARRPGKVLAFIATPLTRAAGSGACRPAANDGDSPFHAGITFAPVVGKFMQLTTHLAEITACDNTALMKPRRADGSPEPCVYLALHDLCALLRGIADMLVWTNEDIGGVMNLEIFRCSVHARARVERLVAGLLTCAGSGQTDVDIVQVQPHALIEHVLETPLPAAALKADGNVHVVRFLAVKAATEIALRNLISDAAAHRGRDVRKVRFGSRQHGSWLDFPGLDDDPAVPPYLLPHIHRPAMLPHRGLERV